MAGMSIEISKPEYMHIQRDMETMYGCDQDWYRTEWRRLAGCGPVAATNILLYLRKRYDAVRIPYKNENIDEAVSAMDDTFLYVRPGVRGLNTVEKLVKGMNKIGCRYGLSFVCKHIIIPPQPEKRPNLDEVIRFIEEGLSSDVPIAFLNLHAGDVEAQLSSWHWVTVVGITKTSAATVLLSFFDQAKRLEVDLCKWLGTTKRGGGFAYFHVQ